MKPLRSVLRTFLNVAPVTVGDPVNRLNILSPTPGNLSRQLSMMEENGTIYQIVHRLSESESAVDWSLYRKNGPRADEHAPRRTVARHAALDLLNSPNPFYSRQALMETGAQHLELTGEAFWVVAYFEGTTLPSELWPVRPDRMIPVPGGPDFLHGWIYTGPSGERVPLTNEEVIQIKFPHPRDPYRGLSPIMSVLSTVEAVDMSQRWNRNFFRNSAEPNGVIEVPSSLGDTEFERIQMQWGEHHRGVSAAHRVGILENGMKWVPSSATQRDMQFVEMLNLGREVIRESYGISKTMLGLSEDVNRATADTAEVIFARYLLEGRLNRFKGMLNSRLLPLYGSTGIGVEFDYECVVPEDEAAESAKLSAKTNAFKTLLDAGVDPDSAAAVCGLPPMNMSGSTMSVPPTTTPTTGGPGSGS
ncbi:MAG: phage portal protein [Acidimicrobiia bacterium]|jgi:HK97 family phage portal protein